MLRLWSPLIFLLITVVSQLPAMGQPPAGGRQLGPQPAQQALPQPVQQQGALAPAWIPLEPAHAKLVHDILKYWEGTTEKVKRYRCQFKRWETGIQKTYSEGSIKFSAPDKGLFKVESFRLQAPPKNPGEKPQWDVQPAREHWVCDGKKIFEFDARNKQLKERELPPQMQGKQIVDGPLPFLFGAKAEQIKQRFWIRVVTKPDVKDEYWLEAVPKTSQDAANFKAMTIILAREDFLPKGMMLLHRNNERTTFAFENRETNWNNLATQLNPFANEFFAPKTPPGWKRVKVPLNPQPEAPQAAAIQQGATVQGRPVATSRPLQANRQTQGRVPTVPQRR